MKETKEYIVFRHKETGEYAKSDNGNDVLGVTFEAFKEKIIPLYLLSGILGYEPVVVEKIK